MRYLIGALIALFFVGCSCSNEPKLDRESLKQYDSKVIILEFDKDGDKVKNIHYLNNDTGMFEKQLVMKVDTLKNPKVLRVEPASFCNLRCIHCPTGTVDKKRGVMGLEIFDTILEQVSTFKMV